MFNTIGNIILMMCLFGFCADNAKSLFFCSCFMGAVFTHQIISAVKSKK